MGAMSTSFRVSLSTSLRDWVRREVRRKGYGTPNQYFLQLLRHDRLRAEQDRVDATLADALDSGAPAEMTSRDWRQIRTEGRKRAARRRVEG